METKLARRFSGHTSTLRLPDTSAFCPCILFLYACVCCVFVCVYQQCAISAPCSKTKGNKETREPERHRRGKIWGVESERGGKKKEKRIVFIISSTQRNLITLVQQRGLIAKEPIRPVSRGVRNIQIMLRSQELSAC